MMKDSSEVSKFEAQARMLANRVVKRFRHLKKRFARRNIDVFRLYDWDIPEIRAVVDWYAGHLVIGEYTRAQSVPEWLPMMGRAVADALEVPADHLHLKERKAGRQDGKRYTRLAHTNRKIIVQEGDLSFYVNPWDFVDTGLFGDHRETRRMIREMAGKTDFLNLFCYTGAFTCYAVRGGARSTTSVDRSRTAISWAGENLKLNGIPEIGNHLVQAHTLDFLRNVRRSNRRFDLAVVDPPSYSTTRSRDTDFDILRDHPALLEGVIGVMKEGGVIFFSTNHQDFIPHMEELAVVEQMEITDHTIPEDYAGRRNPVHRCWKMRV